MTDDMPTYYEDAGEDTEERGSGSGDGTMATVLTDAQRREYHDVIYKPRHAPTLGNCNLCGASGLVDRACLTCTPCRWCFVETTDSSGEPTHSADYCQAVVKPVYADRKSQTYFMPGFIEKAFFRTADDNTGGWGISNVPVPMTKRRAWLAYGNALTLTDGTRELFDLMQTRDWSTPEVRAAIETIRHRPPDPEGRSDWPTWTFYH